MISFYGFSIDLNCHSGCGSFIFSLSLSLYNRLDNNWFSPIKLTIKMITIKMAISRHGFRFSIYSIFLLNKSRRPGNTLTMNLVIDLKLPLWILITLSLAIMLSVFLSLLFNWIFIREFYWVAVNRMKSPSQLICISNGPHCWTSVGQKAY